MAKNNKKYFYIGKGSKDNHPWLYYGKEAPIIVNDNICSVTDCKLIGSFDDNPIADSIEDNTIVKIYIRKEKKNE